LVEFNDRQKLILKQNEENNDESFKTFQQYDKEATEILNQFRKAHFLRPLTNLLSENEKEDFKKYIIQTNEIASAEEAYGKMLEWWNLETQNQSNKISEIQILLKQKPEAPGQKLEPQTIVQISLPSSSP
jgi:hypothetical protein